MKVLSLSIDTRKKPIWLLKAMAQHYCVCNHRKGNICIECRELVAFEEERFHYCAHCVNNENCTRQCYPTATRLKINHIVKWGENRMKWRKFFIISRHYLAIKFQSSKYFKKQGA